MGLAMVEAQSKDAGRGFRWRARNARLASSARIWLCEGASNAARAGGRRKLFALAGARLECIQNNLTL